MSDETRRIVGLLAESRGAEAKELAETALVVLAERARETRFEMDFLLELVATIPTESTDTPSSATPPAGRTSKAELRLAVLSSADALAKTSNGGRVSTVSLDTYMSNLDQERPSLTAIGLILHHSPDWRRLDKGLYERAGDPEEGVEDLTIPI